MKGHIISNLACSCQLPIGRLLILYVLYLVVLHILSGPFMKPYRQKCVENARVPYFGHTQQNP